MSNTLAKRVAIEMWKADGMPEKCPYDATSVGKDWYEQRANEVLNQLLALGYVVRRKS